ncbi:hypothetical protein BDV96DRAFT_593865 [Lophiotrema nucula]|uniref:RDRP C-terminal head domain-containing protein n=1 Tax=Lophiotrema nucula TaxID=690887 RepID=A0A6A5ZQE0_9PLEO|nr:hypothetical protein BDV96DRAFT_593865 [Lophiotrema nucula]
MYDTMISYRSHHDKHLTELEVSSGILLGKNPRGTAKAQRDAIQEAIEHFNEHTTFTIDRILYGDGEDRKQEETLPRAVACFKVALETEGWERNEQLQSFKYVAAAVCLEQLWFHGGEKLKRL